jgi:TonB family protein
MFGQLQDENRKRRVSVTSASVALHGALLAWLLHAPEAIFVAPSSVRFGEPTGSVTQLYWPEHPSDHGDAGAAQTKSAATPQPAKKRLTFPLSAKAAKRKADQSSPQPGPDQPAAAASNQPNQPAPAGSRYGSLSSGPAWGPEVRPALWASGADPVITSTDLAGIREGNVVIEITIDDQGNVIETRVMESLSPLVDQKVTQALVRWHFRPATRDGVAIASKQDVYYHYPVRVNR